MSPIPALTPKGLIHKLENGKLPEKLTVFSFFFFLSKCNILCKNHTDFIFKVSIGTIFQASGKVFPEGAIINSI